MIDLSVITVTWNSAKYISGQIKSVGIACQNINFEEIILDNASSDNTASLIERYFPNVKLIKNNFNAGFAGGYNKAVQIAQGKYFLYLNPDMEMRSSIVPLVDYLTQHPEVGMVSGKLVTKSGEINPHALPRRFPTGLEVLAIFFKLPHIFPKILNNYLYKEKKWDQIQEVDSVRGSFMLVRRELVDRLGFAFDPRYFLWWEDVDLCREIHRLGYKIIYNPATVCADGVGRSFSRRGLIWKQWRFFSSAIKYFRKWKKIS